jgi:hypothetical protein
MAMIYQASAGVANAKKLTISMWCKAETTNAPSEFGETYSLLEFGDTSGSNPTDYLSYIGLATNTNGTNSSFVNNVYLQLAGARDSIAGVDAITYGGGTNPPGYSTMYRPKMPPQDSSSSHSDEVRDLSYTPYFYCSTKDLGAVVTPGKWFHLLIAADASNVTTYGGQNAGMFIAVNGVADRLYGPAGASYDAWDIGTMQPAMVVGEDIDHAATGLFQFGPWHEARATDDMWGSIPAFDLAINGFEIGIPSQRTSSNFKSGICMGDVQIWVDKFIDPTNPTNLSKLVNVVNGHGSAVNTDIAADYFGPQTYLFKGVRDDFIVNRGTGGAFSSTGTIDSTTFGGW